MKFNKGIATILIGSALIFTGCKCEKNPNLKIQDGVNTAAASGTAAAATAGDAISGAVDAAGNAIGDAADAVKKAFADISLGDLKLKGYSGGFEDSMIKFLNDGNYTNAANDDALKSTWYNFDQVQFEHGSTDKLMEGSENQLENLVSILKAFPDTKIKIGGYTDKTGDDAVNMDVSQKRADFIKTWLEGKGVGSQVTGAEGYGSEFATVAEDASDEERAVDRKMAVRFAK